MFCRRCRYPLDGLPSRACPECGLDFDPNSPESFSVDPRHWRDRALRWGIGVVATCGAVALLSLLPLPYVRYVELDVRSGHQRTLLEVFGVVVDVSDRPSVFADFASRHLSPLGPPRWHRAHRSTPFDSMRVNYRAGGILAGLHGLSFILEDAEIPLDVRVQIAQIAMSQASNLEQVSVMVADDGGIQLMNYDKVIAEWSFRSTRLP